MKLKQALQEEQYSYPYHHIPQGIEGDFSQTHHWSWGYRYLGGIRVILEMLRKLEFDSLIDVGCGDGRLLRELAMRYGSMELLGIDNSKRAIGLAQAMNPSLQFRVLDAFVEPMPKPHDIATMMEVLEHIEPAKVPKFIGRVSEVIRPGGCLILTVPHRNKPLQSKHYQHFDSYQLAELLKPYFRVIDLAFFDKRSRTIELLAALLGGSGRHYIITNPLILSAFFKLYLGRFLYAERENQCNRIAALCMRRNPG